MIWESAPWKQMLMADAALLERWATRSGKFERQSFIFEKKIFLSAYAIRKLFDARKLSDSFTHRNIRCAQFERSEREITPLNTHKIDELYFLNKPSEVDVSARKLLDQIIHSRVFALSAREEDMAVDGFYVASDRDAEKQLVHVPLVAYCKYMRDVGDNYPSQGSWRRDSATGKWIISIE